MTGLPHEDRGRATVPADNRRGDLSSATQARVSEALHLDLPFLTPAALAGGERSQ
jgi:hypothetical protein